MLGVLASGYRLLNLGSTVWLVLVVLGVVVAAARPRFIISALMVLIFSLLLGWQFGSGPQADIKIYQALIGQNISLSGQIQDDISTGRTGANVIRLHKLKLGSENLAGSVLVMTRNSTDHLRRGDQLTLQGKLDDGLGGYVATMPNAQIVNATAGSDFGVRWRDFLADKLELALPNQSAQLIEAFLLGKRRMFEQKLIDDFTTTGLVHLLVASGFHLTLIAGSAKSALAKYSRKLALVGSLALSLIFILMTGFSASMVRAGLVVALATIVWYYGRQFQPLKLLLLVMGASLFINPLYLWGDAAWWLSFMSFFGVLIVAPILIEFFYGQVKLGFFKSIIFTSIAAQLAVLPLSMLFFGRISLIAPVANLLVAPLVPALMILGGLIIVAQIVFMPLSGLFVPLVNLITTYVTEIVQVLAEVPLASIGQTANLAVVIGFYVGFGLILTILNQINTKQRSSEISEVI